MASGSFIDKIGRNNIGWAVLLLSMVLLMTPNVASQAASPPPGIPKTGIPKTGTPQIAIRQTEIPQNLIPWQDLFILGDALQTSRLGPGKATGIILHINGHNEVPADQAAMVPAIYGDLNREGWDVQALYFTLPLYDIVPENVTGIMPEITPDITPETGPEIKGGEIEGREDIFARLLTQLLLDYRRQGYRHIALSGQRVPAYHLLQTAVRYPDLPFDSLMINDPTPDWYGKSDGTEGKWLLAAVKDFPKNRALLLSFSENSSYIPDPGLYDKLEHRIKKEGFSSLLIRGDQQRVRRKLTSWSFSPQVFSHFYKDCFVEFLSRSKPPNSKGKGLYDCAPNDDKRTSAEWIQLRADIVESGAEMLTPELFAELLIDRSIEIKTIFGIRAEVEYTADGRHLFRSEGKSYETNWFFKGFNICTQNPEQKERQTCRRIYRYGQDHFIFLNPGNGKVTSWSRYKELAGLDSELGVKLNQGP